MSKKENEEIDEIDVVLYYIKIDKKKTEVTSNDRIPWTIYKNKNQAVAGVSDKYTQRLHIG
jgi:hypothetical protein